MSYKSKENIRTLDRPRWRSHLRGLSQKIFHARPRDKALFLLILTVLVYGSLIAVDNLALRPMMTASFGPTPDLHVYQERTELILNGGMLYRDLAIEAPPLINYAMIMPQILGGNAWIYSAYFSFFSFLTGLALYLAFRRWNDRSAFIVAILFILSPFAAAESTWGIENESILVFTYLVPILLLLKGFKRLASVSLAAGLWTKFMPVIMYPVLLIHLKTATDRRRSIAIVGLISIAVSAPFLLICPIEYLVFPAYYFLGVPGAPSTGISIFHFLELGGVHLPGWLGASVTIGTLIFASLYAYWRKLDLWRSALLVTVSFFAVYPMMRLSYFAIPIAFLLVWASEDLAIALRCFLLYLPLLFATGFSEDVTGKPFFNYEWGWIVGLLLFAGSIIILVDTTRRALKKESFLDRIRVNERIGDLPAKQEEV